MTPTIEPAIGREYTDDEIFCYINTPWGEFAEVPACLGGRLAELNVRRGSKVQRGTILGWIERKEK